jgi:hypothetical protein
LWRLWPAGAGPCRQQLVPRGDRDRPEQLFDAASPESIRERIETLLTDDALRGRIAASARGTAAVHSWEAVAQRAHDAMQKDSESRAASPASPLSARTGDPIAFSAAKSGADPESKTLELERIAFFSPFRPLQSGISDYSEEILPALSERYEVDLYIDSGYDPIVETGFSHAISRYTRFDHNLLVRHKAYRAIIYQMGNSIFHAYMYNSLKRYAGFSVVHDYNMSGMLYHTALTRPEFGISLQEEFIHCYGEKRGREIFALSMPENFLSEICRPRGFTPIAVSSRGL